MIQRRRRSCLIATTTFLAARFARGHNSFPPGAYSRAKQKIEGRVSNNHVRSLLRVVQSAVTVVVVLVGVIARLLCSVTEYQGVLLRYYRAGRPGSSEK